MTEASAASDDTVETTEPLSAPGFQLFTYRYRVLPTKGQHRRLEAMLEHTRWLYNLCLKHRRDAWDHARRWDQKPERITRITQQRDLTILRCDEPAIAAFSRRLQAWAIDCLHHNYASFFALRKAGDTRARRPGFRSRELWGSFGYNAPNEARLKGSYLKVAGMQSWLRLQMPRPLPVPWDSTSGRKMQTVKGLRFVRQGRRWFVHITVAVPMRSPRQTIRRPTGVDVGVTALAVLSDGTVFANPRISNGEFAELRCRDRTFSRRTRKDAHGRALRKQSRRREKACVHLKALHAKMARRRQAAAHKISAEIVRRHDAVAVERLDVRGLGTLRRPSDGRRGRSLRRNIHDAALGNLLRMIAWKCIRDGRRFAAVDPRGTTQACSGCHAVVPKTLRDRVHRCPDCGLVMDRDVNAARNVLDRTGWGPGAVKPGEALRSPGSARKPPRLQALCDHAGPSPVTPSNSVQRDLSAAWP